MTMTKRAFLVLKGFFLGIANLIPGVSGGTIAVTLGIYEYVIDAINNLRKKFKDSFYKLLPIILGVFLSFVSMSKVIKFGLDKYQMQTILFFVGLIVGGMPMLFKKIKKTYKFSNIIWLVIAFSIVMTFILLKDPTNVVSLNHLIWSDYILLFLVGIIASATMIIPGISGSFVLMLLGYYSPIIDTLSNLTNFDNLGHNLLILVPFGIGVLVGLILMVKLIRIILDKYEIKFYYGIIGFVIASIISILLQLTIKDMTFLRGLASVIFFFWGFFVTKALLNENK